MSANVWLMFCAARPMSVKTLCSVATATIWSTPVATDIAQDESA